MIDFLKISIKMKSFKTFCESQTTICPKKIFKPPPDKSFLSPWNKSLRTETFRNIQTFASKCSKNTVVGRLKMVQCKCFFWHHQQHVSDCVVGVIFLVYFLMLSKTVL